MAKLSEKQIEALEKWGFRRWTKGDKDRLYIRTKQLPNVRTIWKENGKICLEINGEELSYTKSSEVNYASIYIDLADGSIHVDSSFSDVLTEGVEMVLNSVSITEKTNAADETPAEEKDIEAEAAERLEMKKAFAVIALAESILKPFSADENVGKELDMLKAVKASIAGKSAGYEKLMAKLEDMDGFVGLARKIADAAAAKVAPAM